MLRPRPTTGLRPVLLAWIALAAVQPPGPVSAATSTLRVAGTAKELAAKTRAAAKVDKRARASAKKVFRGDPALRARILPEGLDPGAARDVEVTNRDGSTSTFTLDPAALGEFEIGRAVDLGRERSNLLALYSMLYRHLPAAALGELPPPQALATLPAGRVRKGFLLLGELIVRDFDVLRAGISETIPAIMATNPIGDCTAEYGWESPTSESAGRCDVSEYAADGIIRNVDFALEDSLTCVKSQGDRSTCAAQAIVAGVETAAMASGGGPENLSEQSAYFLGKVSADWTKRYGGGMPVGPTLQAMSANGWRFPLESDWNYNQSLGIQDLDPVTNQRPGSCSIVYSGEMCTDYEFQAVERIELVLGLPTLVEYDFPAAASNSGHQVSSWASIPDFDVPPGGSLAALQLETVALLLESRIPVIAGIAVPDAFFDPADGGYVRNVPGQVSYGNHGILLVGFVANADLPAGVEADTGPLGGYFVAKNSWATWWGDCGFAYLASDFLDAWGTAYHALEID